MLRDMQGPREKAGRRIVTLRDSDTEEGPRNRKLKQPRATGRNSPETWTEVEDAGETRISSRPREKAGRTSLTRHSADHERPQHRQCRQASTPSSTKFSNTMKGTWEAYLGSKSRSRSPTRVPSSKDRISNTGTRRARVLRQRVDGGGRPGSSSTTYVSFSLSLFC